MHTSPKLLSILLGATLVCGGCSVGSSLSTSSLLGGSGNAAPPPITNTPTARAFQVGSVSARATKCGYNFDSNKLRSNFLASEAAAAPGTDQGSIQQTYDTAFSGVSKAAASKEDYCSASKTKDIKQALTRHLAGDYTPDPPKPVEQEEGIFSGFGSSSDSSSGVKSSLPTDNSGI